LQRISVHTQQDTRSRIEEARKQNDTEGLQMDIDLSVLYILYK